MAELLHREQSYAILGACFAVYNDKGPFFTEPVYHDCLEVEFRHLQLPFASKPPIPLFYRGQPLRHSFEPDFICFQKIVLEIKAADALVQAHRAQTINYVHAGDFDLGLLVNFGGYPKLQWERFLHSKFRPSKPKDAEPFEL